MKGYQWIGLALALVVLAALACGPLGSVNQPSVSEPTTEPAAVVTLIPTLLPSPIPEQVQPAATDQPAVQGDGKLLRQWAIMAAASTEYGEDGWSAMQATGAPNTEGCADLNTAWASAEAAGIEWLELTYAVPVRPTEVIIVQTHNPDHVVKVEMITTVSDYITVYEGDPRDMGEEWCPYNLSVAVDADYIVSGVRVTIDQTELQDWCEIDAVELIGYTVEE